MRYREPGVAWCAVACGLLIGAAIGQGVDTHRLDWQPDLVLTQPWRAWTAAFVHFSRMHIAGNVAGVLLTAAFGWVARVPSSLAVAWAIAWPLTQIGLWIEPSLRHYGGLSGVVHAGVAIAAAQLVADGHRGQRVVGVLVLGGLLVKVISETPWRGPLLHPEGWDIAIAPMAHASGLVAGLLCFAAARLWQRTRSACSRAG